MIGHYLATALRGFARNPLSTAIKLLALALGLVCLLTAHVIGDHFRHADRQWDKAQRTYLVVQETARPGGGWDSAQLSANAPVGPYLRVDFPELEHVARLFASALPARRPGQDQVFPAYGVDPEFLDIFPLEMAAGEASLDRPRTALIEERVAQSLFGNEPAVGQILTLDGGVDVTVGGVYRALPRSSHLSPEGGFSLLMIVDMQTWDDAYIARVTPQALAQGVPLSQIPRPSEAPGFQGGNFLTYAVLPADGSLSAAEFNDRLAAFAERRIPEGTLAVRFNPAPVSSISETRFNQRVGSLFGASIITALYALGALTLAVGCVNFANLSVAQATVRAREIGLRKTVGATRRQIMLQMLTESLILVAVALAIVLPVTRVLATELSERFQLFLSLPGLERLDYWAAVFGIAAAVAIAAGVYPALVMANMRPVFAIRMGGLRGRSGIVRTLLIGAQFAAAGFLLALVVIMLAQKSDLRRIALQPGEDPVVSINLPPIGQVTSLAALEDRLEGMRQQLLASPAVTAVTFRGSQPFTAQTGAASDYSQSLDPSARRFPGQARRIYYDYFRTMGVEIVAGREFSRETDDTFTVMIDTATAELMGYTPQEAIGQSIYRVAARESTVDTAGGQTEPYEFEIIGVVEREPLELTSEGPTNFLYVVSPTQAGIAIVRLHKDNVDGGLQHVSQVWRSLGAPPQMQPAFLDEAFEQSYRAFTMINVVFIVLSSIAVAIAAMGLFGLASFVVQRRLREIGVRKTLGASSGRVMGLVLWDFSKPVILANLAVLPVSVIAAQLYLNNFVTRIDLTPLPFLFALGACLAIAWVAVGAQAFRAARVKPALILKTE